MVIKMGSLTFSQEIQSLRSALNDLNKIIKNPSSRLIYLKAQKNKEIQLERIEWFARGYYLKEKEIKSQEKLP